MWMQWPETLQTNSFSVQLFKGSVIGLEVPDRVVEIVGKLPLKDKENSEKQNKGTQISNYFFPCHSHHFSKL